MASSKGQNILDVTNRAIKQKGSLKELTEALEGAVPSDFVASGDFGWTALHFAAGQGTKEMVQTILEAGASIDILDADLETPLHLACQQGNKEVIEYLLEKKANVMARNKDGETPLHVAVQHVGGKQDLSYLATLVSYGGDVSAKDNEGHTVLAAATFFSTSRAREITAALSAAEKEKKKATKPAEEKKQPLLETSDVSRVLMVAAKRGQAEQITQLLDLKPDERAAQQALVPAAAAGHIKCVEALIAGGADITKPAAEWVKEDSSSPLIAAAEEGASRMVRWLLAARVDPCEQTSDGATPLMAASLKGQSDCIRALLAADSDPNVRAMRGWTALMSACQAGRTDAVKLLLDARANLDEKNDDGATAKDLAAGNANEEVVELLRKRAMLNARQQTKVQATSKTEAVADERDMEDLLAELGEGNASKGKKKNKKSGGKANADVPQAQPAPKQAGKATSTAPSIKPVEEPAADLTTKKKGKKGASEATAPAATTNEGKKVGDEKSKGAEPAENEALKIRARLKEINLERARLDAEELQLRRKLDDLTS